MEFVKQIWAGSRALKIAVAVAAVGLVLAVATARRDVRGRPSAVSPGQPPQILEDLKNRVGGGATGKIGEASGKVADAAGKVAQVTGRTAEAVGKGIDVVDGVFDKVLTKKSPEPAPNDP